MAKKRERIEVATEQLHQHVVVHAWMMAGNRRPFPERIEMLRRRKKSTVYRVPGIGIDGSAVIAKRCRIASALVERNLYEILTTLQPKSLHYYGFAEDPDGAFGWVFVEDAGGERFDRTNDDHRRLGARWLARLHTSTQGCNVQVPELNAAYYFEHLNAARARVRQYLSNDELSADARAVFETSVQFCNAIESRWSHVERTFKILPRTLVHNDFTKYNVRVRRHRFGSELLAFDWEVAGWGLPSIDLLNVDFDEYWRHVRADWGRFVERGALERSLWVAMLLRGGVAAIRWEAENLSLSWMDGPIQNLRVYLRDMTEAQQHLDWCA